MKQTELQEEYGRNSRSQLKLDIWTKRQISSSRLIGTNQHLCAICRKPIRSLEESHMHEWLITRGKAMKSAIPGGTLYSKANCVLRHGICPTGETHSPGSESWKNRALCYGNVLAFEGEKAIMDWIEEVAEYSEGLAEQAIRDLGIIKETYEGMKPRIGEK